MSGEETAVLMGYLDFLSIDPHQSLGPIQWVEEFGTRGVEVTNPAWTLEFLQHVPVRHLTIGIKSGG